MKNQFRSLAGASALAILISTSAHAQGVDRAAVLDTFVLHPDFDLSFVAHEPQMMDPVDLEFDQFGRPFVMEMPDYPYRDTGGRVILLEDSDNDGYYETRKVFAEDLGAADSLLPYDDGILVASPPDLLFLKDTDGDDVADVREVVLSGFATGNPQHNFNGLSHGIDNWIYGANGGNGGALYWPETPDEKIGLGNNDFRVNLRTRQVEPVGHSTGGFGLAFDDYGRMFGTHNLEPVGHLVFPGSYLEGVPTPSLGSLNPIVPDLENGLVRLYPLGAQATRVNHPEQSGYFSGGCGITHYGGGAFPSGFNGNLLVCDVVLNLVHRRVLQPDGTTFTTTRGRPGVEFLASTDRAFRPVNMTAAPDGSLWVIDMHREVIEHPEWIPRELREGMDLEAGKTQGRVFRVSPKKGPRYGKPDFPRGDFTKVAEALGHPNQWWRQTAQRLLVQWNDPVCIDFIDLLPGSPNPFARIHSMWVLDFLGELPPISVTLGIQDPDPAVRENALRIAAPRIKDNAYLQGFVAASANDDDPRVRMYVALLLGLIDEPKNPRIGEAVRSIAARDLGDPFTRLALLPAIARDPVPVLNDLLHNEALKAEDMGELVELIGELVGKKSAPDQVLGVLHDATAADTVYIALLNGLSHGLALRDEHAGEVTLSDDARQQLEARTKDAPFETVEAVWRLMKSFGVVPADRLAHLEQARTALFDESQEVSRRVAALRLLDFEDFQQREDLLFDFLDPRHAPELQAEAVRQLGEGNSTHVAEELVARWNQIGPKVRPAVSDLLLYRRANHDLLLTALENKSIGLGEMNLHLERRRVLLRSNDKNIRKRAEALFTDAGVTTRKEALEKMRPAITLAGDAEKGGVIFGERCAKCHQLGGEGASLAPNLTEIYRKSKETILHDMLDPNAAVDNRYVAFTVETNDFQIVTGIIEDENSESVTLRTAENEAVTIPKRDIDKMTSGGLSLMPENLEEGLTPQDIANLLAHLTLQR